MTDDADSKLYVSKCLSCSLNLNKFLSLRPLYWKIHQHLLTVLRKLFCPGRNTGTREPGNANLGTEKKNLVQERGHAEHEPKSEEPGNAEREGSTGERPPLVALYSKSTVQFIQFI